MMRTNHGTHPRNLPPGNHLTTHLSPIIACVCLLRSSKSELSPLLNDQQFRTVLNLFFYPPNCSSASLTSTNLIRLYSKCWANKRCLIEAVLSPLSGLISFNISLTNTTRVRRVLAWLLIYRLNSITTAGRLRLQFEDQKLISLAAFRF